MSERQARNYEKIRTIVQQDRRDNNILGQAKQRYEVQATMDQKHNLMMSTGGIASDDDDKDTAVEVGSPER